MNLKQIVEKLEHWWGWDTHDKDLSVVPAFQELKKLADTELDAVDIAYGEYNLDGRKLIYNEDASGSKYIGIETNAAFRFSSVRLPKNWELIETSPFSLQERSRLDILEGRIVNIESRMVLLESKLLDREIELDEYLEYSSRRAARDNAAFNNIRAMEVDTVSN